jgi:plastocyanin
MRSIKSTLLTALLALGAAGLHAQDASYTLVIKDHLFTPSTLEVPAGKKIALVVKNEDKTPEEFESDDLRREKIIPAGKEITITVGPLKPGTYRFKGEFHAKTAQGILVVK